MTYARMPITTIAPRTQGIASVPIASSIMRASILLAVLLLPLQLLGQTTGILAPSRVTDFSYAGISGGIPSASWTQCVNTQCAAVTTAACSATASQMNAALQNAPDHTYVLLPGTVGTPCHFSFTAAQIKFTKGNVAIRGGGANATFLAFSGNGVGCNGNTSVFCAEGDTSQYWGSYVAKNWLTGFAQGATSITLSDTTGLTAGMLIVLNQCDTGRSGSGCSGTETDNGNAFNCGDQYTGTGCSQSGPDGGNGTLSRFMNETHTVLSVSGTTVTLAEPLSHPNWALGQSPQAWYIAPISNIGIENMSIDGSGYCASHVPSCSDYGFWGVEFVNASNVWVTGTRWTNNYGHIIQLSDVSHAIVQSNYFFEEQYSDDMGVAITNSSFLEIDNNIFEQQLVGVVCEGPCSNTVVAHNLFIGNCNLQYNDRNGTCSDGLGSAIRPHSNGTDEMLIEGNIGTQLDMDKDHGSHLFNTFYRNFLTGWENCGINQGATLSLCGTAGVKDFLTNTLVLASLQGRYEAAVNNVLGTPGYHTTYQYTTGLDNHAVYDVGASYGSAGPTPVPDDPIVGTTLMRWCNWDVVHGSVQCNNSEVPSGISVYPNSVPTVCTAGTLGTCPASFYLASKPSWWTSGVPYPAIGSDVTGGNIGQVSGTLNTAGKYNGSPALTGSVWAGSSVSVAWGGHVNANPAANCYFNKMGGDPAGAGSALNFNASVCYPSGGPTPGPPSNLDIIVLQ